MNRPLRISLTIAGIVIAILGLGYLAHSMNLIDMLVAMHTPPQH